MSIDIRLPNITASTSEGQLAQIRSYLYSFAEQLNWALNNIDIEAFQENVVLPKATSTNQSLETGESALTRFNEIKSLIIKSADIVSAYYDKINKRLSGVYVAQSDFGDYAEETENSITLTSEQIEAAFKSIGTIYDNIEFGDNATTLGRTENKATIKTGLIDTENGVPIYGIEIGQITDVNGNNVFNKCARFTSGELAFYSNNDGNAKVAYISDYKMYITEAEIIKRLKIGNYIIEEQNGGLAFIYV